MGGVCQKGEKWRRRVGRKREGLAGGRGCKSIERFIQSFLMGLSNRYIPGPLAAHI